jgi:DNA-binding NarL/FixJ family response regulator
MLTSTPAVTVVGEARSVVSAGPTVVTTRAHIAVISADLLEGDGIDQVIALGLTGASVKRVVIGSGDDHLSMGAARRAGAAAYISCSAQESVVLETIQSVMRRSRPTAPAQRGSAPRIGDPRLGSLGPREREIVTLMAKGLTNRQISDELHIAESTLKNHISSIFGKLAVKNRLEAASLVNGNPREQA